MDFKEKFNDIKKEIDKTIKDSSPKIQKKAEDFTNKAKEVIKETTTKVTSGAKEIYDKGVTSFNNELDKHKELARFKGKKLEQTDLVDFKLVIGLFKSLKNYTSTINLDGWNYLIEHYDYKYLYKWNKEAKLFDVTSEEEYKKVLQQLLKRIKE